MGPEPDAEDRLYGATNDWKPGFVCAEFLSNPELAVQAARLLVPGTQLTLPLDA